MKIVPTMDSARRDKGCFCKIVITFRGECFNFVNCGSADRGKKSVKGVCDGFLVLIVHQTT